MTRGITGFLPDTTSNQGSQLIPGILPLVNYKAIYNSADNKDTEYILIKRVSELSYVQGMQG